MKNRFIFAATLLIITAPFYGALYQPVHAQEFAYVTDSLQLRVYASASASSELLQSIDSGDSVEVFATENGFSKVTTYDGTVGWVKSAFLVLDPPAKLLYYSVGEKNKELEAEIETLKSNVQSSTTTTTSNEADATIIYELKAALSKEQENNHELQEQLADKGNTQTTGAMSSSLTTEKRTSSYFENNKWMWLALPLLLLIAGLLLGIKISSWRLRKRLHGFRI